jgi:pimeloyl-ACP methyl ester carboxylesterase
VAPQTARKRFGVGTADVWLMPTIVLVPGGFLGPWVWEKVEASLHAAGVRTRTVPLRSVLAAGQHAPGDLHADAAAVRETLDRLQPPVLVCGHSYGGVVITQAAAGPHRAVRHLVYLAAGAPDAGESLADLAAGQHDTVGSEDQAEHVQFRADGTIALDPASAAAGLFNDCDQHTASQAAAQLQPMNPQVNRQPVTAAAWRQIPTTYVRCTNDRLPELVSKQFLDHVDDVLELPTGHCPQWSRPDIVTALLLERIRTW